MNITEPSVYLVQAGHSPYSVLVFPKTASGDTPPTAEIPGTLVSLDSAGDIYVLSPSGNCIVEYPSSSPSAITPARFLPVGPGTKISAAKDLAVSPRGEIFVSDGKGIAVFSTKATGDADPVRYITGVSQTSAAITPGNIAVDSQGNLYVENTFDSTVVVFGPTDTGTVVPSRVIEGHLVGSGVHINFGMVTDSSGNLFVLCLCARREGGNDFAAYEFGPTANGIDQPIRSLTSPSMYPWSGGPGIALDAADAIYITAGPPFGGTQTVFEFSTQASGSALPVNTVTSSAVWTDTLVSHIVVH